jgi:hypothetical protein
MYSLNQINKLVSCGRDPARSLPLWRGFLLIPLILVCFAFLPGAQATCLDGCNSSPTFNTWQGDNALLAGIATTTGNTAFGWRSLTANSAGAFNTALGPSLVLNNADSNTAVGAAALLLNIGSNTPGAESGTQNTAVGTDALVFNTGGSNQFDGSFNDAVGAFALFNNTTGFSNNAMGNSALFSNVVAVANTAVGDLALEFNDADGTGAANFNTAVGAGALAGDPTAANMSGDSNNAVGANALGFNTTGLFNQAMGVEALSSNADGAANVGIGDSSLFNSVNGSFNTVVGDSAGQNVTSGSDNIYIGATAGGDSDESGNIRIGDPNFINACFVAGIFGVSVTGNPVCVDANGQLGECGAGSSQPTKAPRSTKEWLKQRQAMQQLKATTEKQAAKIALQESQIQTLTAALKQQAEQIQKVSAQLEMIRPAPRVVGDR